MLRSLVFFAVLALLVGIAVWLAGWDGAVSFDLPKYGIDLWLVSWDWPKLRIDTSIGLLALGVIAVAVLTAVAYRFWVAVARVPGTLERAIRDGRQTRGYKALTQGMVAVAAGDAEEARRMARKASDLLDAPPLTLLLSAQSAQLGGDDKAARRYFEAMLEGEETRFLGLRGLLTQALRDGDEATALGYAREAHKLRGRTPWVLTTLADLTERQGDLEGADAAYKEAARHKALPAEEAKRKRAVVLVERARAAQAAGDGRAAVKLAREAHGLAPDLVPASALLGTLLTAANRRREALRLLEKAWPAAPHPALVASYLEAVQEQASQAEDGIGRVKQLRKLVAGAPDHAESHLALAEAALDARLWGEARRHLGEIMTAAPGERICRLMARLEEAEHGDAEAARAWLLRASENAGDPAWVCGSCGAAAEAWSARCGACGEFDGLAWRAPPRIVAKALAAEGAGAPTTEPTEVLPPAGGA